MGVIITDSIPNEITNPKFVRTSQISATGSTAFAWQVESLSPGDSGQIIVTGIISGHLPVGYEITNTATITITVLDSNPNNNSAKNVVIIAAKKSTYPIYLPIILKP